MHRCSSGSVQRLLQMLCPRISIGGGKLMGLAPPFRLASGSPLFQSYKILGLPAQYLRDMDDCNHDPATFQRTDVKFDTVTGKPVPHVAHSVVSIDSVQDNGDGYEIQWTDNKVSWFSKDWVNDQIKKQQKKPYQDRCLWTGLTEDTVRSELALEFDTVLTPAGMKEALTTLYKYGILLITQTPINDNGRGIACIAAALGGGSVKNNTSLLNDSTAEGSIVLGHGTDGPLRTLYGTVWSTTTSGQADGASVADTAYGQDALPLHTDMTYHRDPPGLQIFTMMKPSVSGGESVFGDGFAAANKLRQEHPRAYHILASTIRRYRCIDKDTGWHLEASGPVISERNGEAIMIRHNDLDRLPDLLEDEGLYDELKEAHRAWDDILGRDNMRLVMKLFAGDTMVVANQVN